MLSDQHRYSVVPKQLANVLRKKTKTKDGNDERSQLSADSFVSGFFFPVVVVVDFVGIVVVDRGVSNLCPLVPTLRAMCVLFIEILPSLSRIAMNNS